MSEANKGFNGIKGYRVLSDEDKVLMNEAKELEAKVAELHAKISNGNNEFELTQARANLQTGFMWLIRGVALPLDPFNKEQ